MSRESDLGPSYIAWGPGQPLQCGRCGGYSVNMLEDGRASCNECGLVVTPIQVGRYAGLGRIALFLWGLFLAVVAVETFTVVFLAGPSVHALGLAFFVTGLVQLVSAGALVAAGSLPSGQFWVRIRDEQRRKVEYLRRAEPAIILGLFGCGLVGLGMLLGFA